MSSGRRQEGLPIEGMGGKNGRKRGIAEMAIGRIKPEIFDEST